MKSSVLGLVARDLRLYMILAVVVWQVVMGAVWNPEPPTAQADSAEFSEAMQPADDDVLLDADCKAVLKGFAEDLTHAMTALKYPNSFAQYFPSRDDYVRAVDAWALYRETADDHAAEYMDMGCPSGPLIWAAVAARSVARAELVR